MNTICDYSMSSILNCISMRSYVKLINTIHEDPSINSVKLVLQEIFYHFDLPSLAKSCRVCKSWNNAGSEPLVWKTVIFRHSFNNGKWARCFGAKVVADEDREEEWKSLPITIVDEYKKFYRAYPKIKLKDGLMLVRIPKTLNGELSLKSLGALAKQYFPYNNIGYGFIRDSIISELWDNSIAESQWVLMTKKFISEIFVDELSKKGLIGYQSPETLVAAVCVLAQYFDSKTRLFCDRFSLRALCGFSQYYTICKENIQGHFVIIGNFESDGLAIDLMSTQNYRAVATALLKKL